MNHKTKEYRKLLIKSYGSYLTYRGKALNPEDVEIVFADKESETGENAQSYLSVIKLIKEIISPIPCRWLDKILG